jgi:hypothetical protein
MTALATAHVALISALDAKREATRQATPDPIAICRARWNLSRANRQHRSLLDNILQALLPGATPEERVRIEDMREDLMRQVMVSTQHVQSWTPERIIAEWPLFCAASAEYQAGLELRAEVEKELIMEMLTRRARTGFGLDGTGSS